MTDTEWTKEYIEHRDRAATKYFNDWTCGDAPSFRDGADFGAAYERERAKVLISIMAEALVWCDEMLTARDEMNSKVHCAPVRLSPITERVKQALAAFKKERGEG